MLVVGVLRNGFRSRVFVPFLIPDYFYTRELVLRIILGIGSVGSVQKQCHPNPQIVLGTVCQKK